MTTQDSTNTTSGNGKQADYILNKIIFSGNTASAPEFAYTKNGKAVAKVVVFSTRRWTDKATNEPKEKTTKFKVVAWGDVAERMHNLIGKGYFVEFEAQMGTPEAWVMKNADGSFKLDEKGMPMVDCINIADAFEFRVIFTKGTQAAAPTAPVGTPDRDPAVGLPEDMGDIPF